jgi:AcrR family transcriptional regulator
VSQATGAGPLRKDADEACTRRREEILDAATELFAEHGFSDADTQALAERLGVGKGTLYRHFPSKKDLFLAAVDRVMRRCRDRMDEVTAAVADPLDRIEAGVRTYLAFYAEHPKFVELLIQERALFKDREKPTFFEHRERNVVRWRELYRSLIGAGRLRDVPAERVSDVMGDLLYGTIFSNYFGARATDPEAQARDILDVVFHGILSDRERAARCGGRDRERVLPQR